MTSVKREKGSLAPTHERKSMLHPVPKRIAELLLQPSSSNEWFGFAEQAVGAIYNLVEQPDLLCGNLLKKMAGNLFGVVSTSEDEIDAIANALSGVSIANKANKDQDTEETKIPKETSTKSAFELAQLIFFVGHVAIKQIVHLESIESEWKRRKHLKDSENNKKPAGDLEMVTGSIEDEFAEKMVTVKERELLYGPNSLLRVFGPIITQICLHTNKFNVFHF
jgi:condensin complex subunit 1